MDDEVINTENWQELAEKKQGVKILARLPESIGSAMIAYFKYPLNDQAGPIAANEFIASRIGLLLDLPATKTQFKDFADKKGILSFMVPGEANSWNLFPHKDDLENTVEHYNDLAKTIVFDVFIMNTDRNPDNFLYSRPLRKTKYEFHLIDHANSIFGPSKSPPDYSAFNFPSIVSIQEFREIFSKGFNFFKPHIDDITKLDDAVFESVVALVPEEYLSAGERNTIIDLLLERKSLLYNHFEQFCQSPQW